MPRFQLAQELLRVSLGGNVHPSLSFAIPPPCGVPYGVPRPLPGPLDHWFPLLSPVRPTDINTHIIDVCTSLYFPAVLLKGMEAYIGIFIAGIWEGVKILSVSPCSLLLHYKWLWDSPTTKLPGTNLTFILTQWWSVITTWHLCILFFCKYLRARSRGMRILFYVPFLRLQKPECKVVTAG